MLKILKQELLFIPIMLLIVELFRRMIMHFYPETALFDRGSELESFLFRVWQITWITSGSWILLRVIFPPAHAALVRFYHKFEDFTEEYKQEFGIKTFLTFFFALVLLLSGRGSTPEAKLRTRLLDTLNSQLHVRELTGQNDGIEVEKYLRFVGRQRGDAWCAAFASWNLYAIGITKPFNPVSAWAPSFANPKYTVWSQKMAKAHKAKRPQPGDCFTLFYPNLNRVGHVGFIVAEAGGYYITTEGNTGLSGSRDGSGVHRLKRSKCKVYAVNNYITPYINEKNLHASVLRDSLLRLSKKAFANINIQHRADTGQFTRGEGFDLDSCRHAYDKSRQLKHKSNGNRGRQWHGELAGNYNRLAAIKGQSFNYKWETKSRLLMQAIGRGSATSKQAYCRATKDKYGAPGRKTNRESTGSPLHPEMDDTVCMGRGTCLTGLGHSLST